MKITAYRHNDDTSKLYIVATINKVVPAHFETIELDVSEKVHSKIKSEQEAGFTVLISSKTKKIKII